jgi:hypothetical protein
LLVTLSTLVLAQTMTWDEVIAAIGEKRRALSDEAKAVEQQLKTFEEQAKIQDTHVESLKVRLAAMKGMNGSEPLLATKPEGATEGPVAAAEATTDYRTREKELIERGANRMLVVEGKEGEPIGAFLAPQDGQIRIFVSAQWLDQNPTPKVSKLDQSSLPIRPELSCPAGVDLVCLHTDALALPHFELADTSEKPVVGARVVVIFFDPETKQAQGIGGWIRGIGPDTLELDAELTPKMTAAPVLSLDSGKVIGVVAPQVAGVKDEWAIGTRHQGSRHFATRIDRIQEWKASDLGRFAKEAAYIQGINQRTRLAWLAHMLMADRISSVENRATDQSQRERKEWGEFLWKVKDEARKHASNPHIARASNWTTESVGDLGIAEWRKRMSNIYRGILSDLAKEEPDLSEHMTPYHLQQYRVAKASRAEGLRIISQNAQGVGQ